MKSLDVAAIALLVIGGLNWGLVGAANFDLVAALFGPMSALSRVVYLLVGLAAVYRLIGWKAIEQRRSLAPAHTASR
jgi:uncharacterized membrane protein YuzA (DUF378 family)